MLNRKRRMMDKDRGPMTYVSPDTEIEGHIKGKGAYIFAGRMNGDCDIDGPVTLAAGGVWIGSMKATDLIIAGEVQGDVIAEQRVEVAGTARVSGSLAGHSIAVAEGAVIEGEIKVTNGSEPVQFEEKRQASELDPAMS